MLSAKRRMSFGLPGGHQSWIQILDLVDDAAFEMSNVPDDSFWKRLWGCHLPCETCSSAKDDPRSRPSTLFSELLKQKGAEESKA